MKNVLLAISLLCLVSCDDNEEPTTFHGEVVFPQGDERTAKARVLIIGHKSRGIGVASDNVSDTSLVLDKDYRFEMTFPAIDVQYYSLGIETVDVHGAVESSLNVDCLSYDCNGLQPGKRYDLTVQVLE